MARIRVGVLLGESEFGEMFSSDLRKSLETLGELRFSNPEGSSNEKQAESVLAGCEVAISGGDGPHPTLHLIGACPALRLWIHTYGDLVDTPDMRFRDEDFELCKTVRASSDQRAEMVASELVRLLRLRRPALSLSGSRVVVASANGAGVSTASLLSRLQARVVLMDPCISKGQQKRIGIDCEDHFSPDLLRGADAVVLQFGGTLPPTSLLEDAFGSEQRSPLVLALPALSCEHLQVLYDQCPTDHLCILCDEQGRATYELDPPSRLHGQNVLEILRNYRADKPLPGRQLPEAVPLDWSYVLS